MVLRRLSLITTLLFAFVGKTAASPAHTVEAKARAKKVRQLNRQARQSFMLGRYADAAKKYARAYKLWSKPEFIFNIAQCYRKMGTPKSVKKAIDLVENYLKFESTNQPQANKHAAQTLLGELKELYNQIKPIDPIDEPGRDDKQGEKPQRKTGSVASPPTPPKRDRPTPIYKRAWFWVVIGGVVAGGVTTAVLLSRPGSEPGSNVPVIHWDSLKPLE